MANQQESSLSYSYNDLKMEISHYLGWGRGGGNSGSRSDEQNQVIDACVKSGLMKFYVNSRGHQWSFLKPTYEFSVWGSFTALAGRTVTVATTTVTATGTTVFYDSMIGKTITANSLSAVITAVDSDAGTLTVATSLGSASGQTWTMTADGTYQLPDNYAGLDGPITFTDTTNYRPLRNRGDAWIRAAKQLSQTASRPLEYAIRPKTSDGSAGQRWDLLLWPIPDAVYTLSFRMLVAPNSLVDGTYPYPFGYQLHGETILASCLAVAEAKENDDRGRGPMYEDFQERLTASIEADKRVGAAEYLGYNGDGDPPDDWRPAYYVTVDGVIPS